MALETDRPETGTGPRTGLPWLRVPRLHTKQLCGAALSRVGASIGLSGVFRLVGAAGGVRHLPHVVQAVQSLSVVWNRLKETRLFRFFSKTLARRIFVANLLGLAVLVGGMLWLGQHQAWLITAKRESLRVQSEIIAAAIAASASVDTDKLTFDPDRLPEVEGSRLPYRDDAFAAYELSLRPDRVGPVLKRLIQTTQNTRGRIYSRDGDLIVDTIRAVNNGGRPVVAPPADEKIRVKTAWTRMTAWFDRSELPVYREIGSANGNNYPEVRQALRGVAPPPMLLLNDEGKQIVSLAVPIQRKNATLGALLLSTRPGEIDEILSAERWIIFYLVAMAMLATLMASMLLDHTIASPVRRLSAAAEQVSQNISARAELPDYANRRDEVGQMAHSFTRMTAALFRRIESSEKFAADVAHELKNPLAAARSTAESMQYVKSPEQLNQLVGQIQGELKRLNRLITDVANASRLDAELARQKNQPVDMRQTVGNVVQVFCDLHSEDDIRIRLGDSPDGNIEPLVVMGHEGRLAQVVTNLLDNAVSFSKPGQTVTVSAFRAGAEIEIAIDDEGPGMPEDKLEAVFERFYSDRPESDRLRGKNSGLGLSISREIIIAHEGRIWAENRKLPASGAGGQTQGAQPTEEAQPIVGARFVVRLPADQTGSLRGSITHGWRQHT